MRNALNILTFVGVIAALAACSGGGANNSAGANSAVPSASNAAASGTPTLTQAQLVGTRWRGDSGNCSGLGRLEIRSDSIVGTDGPIQVTYEEQLVPDEVRVMPAGGTPMTRLRFRMLGERLIATSLERTGAPCMLVRAN